VYIDLLDVSWLVVQILARQANTGSDSVPIDLDMNSNDGDGEDGMYNLPMLGTHTLALGVT
jgi:hypothetical protein